VNPEASNNIAGVLEDKEEEPDEEEGGEEAEDDDSTFKLTGIKKGIGEVDDDDADVEEEEVDAEGKESDLLSPGLDGRGCFEKSNFAGESVYSKAVEMNRCSSVPISRSVLS